MSISHFHKYSRTFIQSISAVVGCNYNCAVIIHTFILHLLHIFINISEHTLYLLIKRSLCFSHIYTLFIHLIRCMCPYHMIQCKCFISSINCYTAIIIKISILNNIVILWSLTCCKIITIKPEILFYNLWKCIECRHFIYILKELNFV